MKGPSMIEKMRRTSFLGCEFLTWLLYRSYKDEGVFKLERGDVQVLFERAITLEGDNPSREAVTIKVDDPSESEEVELSLALGKKVARARLLVVVDGVETSFVLDGRTLASRSVKLPESSAVDDVERLADRVEAAQGLEDTVEALFLHFLRIRIDKDAWPMELEAMRGWLAGARA